MMMKSGALAAFVLAALAACVAATDPVVCEKAASPAETPETLIPASVETQKASAYPLVISVPCSARLVKQVVDVSVKLKGLAHGFASDLSFVLVKGSTKVPVLQNCFYDYDFDGDYTFRTNATNDPKIFDDNVADVPPGEYKYASCAELPITPTDSDAPPYSVNFTGIDACGNWSLYIADLFHTDNDGSLQSWELEICYYNKTLVGDTFSAQNPEVGAYANFTGVLDRVFNNASITEGLTTFVPANTSQFYNSLLARVNRVEDFPTTAGKSLLTHTIKGVYSRTQLAILKKATSLSGVVLNFVSPSYDTVFVNNAKIISTDQDGQQNNGVIHYVDAVIS